VALSRKTYLIGSGSPKGRAPNERPYPPLPVLQHFIAPPGLVRAYGRVCMVRRPAIDSSRACQRGCFPRPDHFSAGFFLGSDISEGPWLGTARPVVVGANRPTRFFKQAQTFFELGLFLHNLASEYRAHLFP
jgi:hypothetical protein